MFAWVFRLFRRCFLSRRSIQQFLLVLVRRSVLVDIGRLNSLRQVQPNQDK